jgi:hypothetical protein
MRFASIRLRYAKGCGFAHLCTDSTDEAIAWLKAARDFARAQGVTTPESKRAALRRPPPS